MEVILLGAVTFLLSSIPFALVIGHLVLKVDIRQYGDGNPGATNIYRASGSRLWYIVAVVADSFKGAIPVSVAYWGMGWHDWRIVPVAVLAIAGHAFSPFLSGHGGKAVAITGGTWMALTLWQVPIVMGLALGIWYRIIQESDWVVMATMLTVLAYLVLALPQQPVLLLVWLGNFLILLYRHRASLNAPPTLRRTA